MRILQVHNFYQQPGGEDQVYEAEYQLLKSHGDVVERYSVHNDIIGDQAGLAIALETIWNRRICGKLRQLIERFHPDVVHCHNTFPLISPAIYYTASAAGVPVAQTVQNYRLICPAATLLRDGHVCEDCIGHFVPYSGVVHSCYRGNYLASATVASMLTVHRLLGTWKNKVGRYIAPTAFVKAKLVEGGLPADRIEVKPNSLSCDPGLGSGDGDYALFVGRLSPEKGLATLLKAWRTCEGIPLKIAGDGPLSDSVKTEAGKLANVEVLGFQERLEVLKLMQAAAVLIVPSEWYEGFPMTIVEALACGTPVIASDLGSLREVIEDGVNGWRFQPGNSTALASLLRTLIARPHGFKALRLGVRQTYLEKYSAEPNYRRLHEIYRQISSA